MGRLLLALCLGLMPALADAQTTGRGADPQRPGARAPRKAEPEPPRLTREQTLDELYSRLAKAGDEEEGKGLAGAIERVMMRSGSDTADLLMGRAATALQRQNPAIAEELLDKIVAAEPDWAEGWNKRATVRSLRQDDAGAIADIARVLVLEPRHFGALTGLGMLLQRNGAEARALQAYRRALAVHPRLEAVRKIVDRLEIEVEGRSL